MISQLPHKVEMAFWNVAIPAMSNNRFIRQSIQKLARLSQTKDPLTIAFMFGVVGLAGFWCGFILYFLAATIR
ncbi:MAG TPA: hypothetical protein VMC62_00480 [Longilinea sp.]|nr:hypothetical protein [Longilinea sp.]